jgi:long-chain acyl-CoA synthetase
MKTVGKPLEEIHPWPNLLAMLKEAASTNMARKAFTTVLPNGFSATLSFAELDQLSDFFAAYLRMQLRLRKGDRVAVKLPNCQVWPVTVFGILKAGCVAVNVNPLYTEHELSHLLIDSGAKVLVVLDLFQGKLDAALPNSCVKTVVTASLADFFPVHTAVAIRASLLLKKQVGKTSAASTSISNAIAHGKRHFRAAEPWKSGFWSEPAEHGPDTATTLSLEDLAVLQYTGGTTGTCKAAMLTHGNLIANIAQVREAGKERIRPGLEAMLGALPLYHIFAFTVNALTFHSLGAHNVLVPSPRPITNLKGVLERFQFTWITGVNTLFAALTREPWFQQVKHPHLKVSIAGGMALHKKTAADWEAITGNPVTEGYGLTEASPVVTLNPVVGGGKLGSIGIPLPATEISIVDEEGNETVGTEPGELLIHGPQVMLGYWNQPGETSAVLQNGWLRTGDMGYCDEDGFVFLVDRKKDMILVSGFNIYPNEVEEVLVQHKGVVEAAVIGVPDDVAGEQIHAYVVRKDFELTEADLKEHCKLYLTKYKIPKVFIFCTDLPKSNVGKVLRREVRAQAIASVTRRTK